MQKVLAVDTAGVSLVPGKNSRSVAFPASALKEGVVGEVLGRGRYSVVLESGLKVEVRGAAALKPGEKVQVLMPETARVVKGPSVEEAARSLENGSLWSAFVPLGFGGSKANAKLEIRVEPKTKESFKKGELAVYFVFVTQTEDQGEVQWGIHLNGRQIALQVHAPQLGRQKERLNHLVEEVEKALNHRGFVVLGKVIHSKFPLRLPSGDKLNVRG